MSQRDLIAILFFISGLGEGIISFISFKIGDLKSAKRYFYFLIFDLVVLFFMSMGWTPP